MYNIISSRILLCQVFLVEFFYNTFMKFCERLKDLRVENNLSQMQLAKAIGVTQKAIDFWEKEINEPKMTYIILLAKYFKVSTDYLLCLTD